MLEIREKLAVHKEADCKFLEYGLRTFERAQTAYSCYLRRSPAEQRHMLSFFLSNCIMKDETLTATYR